METKQPNDYEKDHEWKENLSTETSYTVLKGSTRSRATPPYSIYNRNYFYAATKTIIHEQLFQEKWPTAATWCNYRVTAESNPHLAAWCTQLQQQQHAIHC